MKLVIPECEEITCRERSGPGERIEFRDRSTNEITGYQTCEGNAFGDSCSYECEDGYNLMGSSVSTCGNDDWDSAIPQCVPADCPERDILRYGFLRCAKRGVA